MEDGVKSLSETVSTALIYQDNFIIESYQAGQELLPLGASMLTIPDHLPVFNVPGNGFQN